MPNRAYVWQRNVPTTPFAAAGYMATAANPLEAALGRLNPNRRRQQTKRIEQGCSQLPAHTSSTFHAM